MKYMDVKLFKNGVILKQNFQFSINEARYEQQACNPQASVKNILPTSVCEV